MFRTCVVVLAALSGVGGGSAAASDSGWALRGATAAPAVEASQPSVAEHPGALETVGRNGLMLFAGPMVSARLGQIGALHLPDGVSPAFFVGAAANREFARFGGFSIEGEFGFGGLIGERDTVSTPQAWGAAFLRYDAFPWNHIVRTSVAASTGVSYTLRESTGELNGKEVRTRRWLHYLAPEVTFAAPERPNLELVGRLHHRSSVFGLFGCEACALNVLTLGVRNRF